MLVYIFMLVLLAASANGAPQKKTCWSDMYESIPVGQSRGEGDDKVSCVEKDGKIQLEGPGAGTDKADVDPEASAETPEGNDEEKPGKLDETEGDVNETPGEKEEPEENPEQETEPEANDVEKSGEQEETEGDVQKTSDEKDELEGNPKQDPEPEQNEKFAIEISSAELEPYNRPENVIIPEPYPKQRPHLPFIDEVSPLKVQSGKTCKSSDGVKNEGDSWVEGQFKKECRVISNQIWIDITACLSDEIGEIKVGETKAEGKFEAECKVMPTGNVAIHYTKGYGNRTATYGGQKSQLQGISQGCENVNCKIASGEHAHNSFWWEKEFQKTCIVTKMGYACKWETETVACRSNKLGIIKVGETKRSGSDWASCVRGEKGRATYLKQGYSSGR